MNSNNLPVVPEETIMNRIYTIRGKRIMLDKDLAELYDVKAFRLREQVKRNMKRFPENFFFRLTEEETDIMVSQNAIPSKQHLGGHLPYAFTEHGVLMLANVLRSERAIQMSIRIIGVFIKIREILFMHKDIIVRLSGLEQTLMQHDEKIMEIFEYLQKLEQTQLQDNEFKEHRRVGFRRNGEQ
jgi:hypothetical protein